MPREDKLHAPGQDRGMLEIVRSRFLLRLIVDKEVQVRYRGSVLGLFWSYIKPAVQFAVFYLAMGVFLQLERGISHFAIYLFSGMVAISLFNETFGNAARSIVGNGHLIKKIYLPRALFPASSLWVAIIHFFPQIVVLMVACLATGWRPSATQLLSALIGFLLVALFALGLGLLFTTANVFFRDAENIVDLVIMVATWLSPVLYQWTMVRKAMGDVVFALYMLNPITVAVEHFHNAFWAPTTQLGPGTWSVPPQLFSLWTPLAAALCLVVLILGDWTFRRFEGRFAQEL